MKTQNFEEWEKLIAGYVLGDLTTEEAIEVNQLLVVHPELESEVDQLVEVLSLLPLALPQSYPSTQLKSKIIELAFPETQLTSLKISPKNSPLAAIQALVKYSKNIATSLNKTYLVGAAMVVLVLGIGFDGYRSKQQLASTQSELHSYQEVVALLMQPNNRLLTLKGIGDVPTTASGSLLIATETSSGILTIQNLAKPPQNMSYRLWAFIDGKKTYITEFTPNQTGSVMLRLRMNQILLDAKSVVITLEPEQLELEPNGESVMEGEVSL